MSQFYARYVPPTSQSPPDIQPASKVEKRKQHPELERRTKKKKQKLVVDNQDKQSPEIKDTESREKIASHFSSEKAKQAAPGKPISAFNGESILSKYSISAFASGKNERVKMRNRDKVKSHTSNALDTETTSEGSKLAKKKPKEKRRKSQTDGPVLQPDDEEISKHASVLSKFSKVKADQPPGEPSEPEGMEIEEKIEVHGLEPLPQPETITPIIEKPAYSTLPAWQSNTVKVVHSTTRKFSQFHMSDTMVANLMKHGLEESLPVQTTVLPLLLEGSEGHEGDLCVSAATGSGKTLAYVVPMIEALKDHQTRKLRGLVVVPTRELVQQVRQLYEICAAGTSLKIATAAGNKSLKDEQRIFVSEEEVYDPAEYDRQQKSPIDWSNFSIEKLMIDAKRRNPLNSVHFVRQFKSNIDILITTPGRLVDHLRSTDGFTLDFVSWLVVDEADRLLNESYQEWIDTVTPALQSKAATTRRDNILRYMRIEVPKRVVRKVLLSATMTRDISKLNSLGLENPKLVVLGSAALNQGMDRDTRGNASDRREVETDQDGAFTLPPTLSEYAVSIKERYDKPLYLIHLLQTRILNRNSASGRVAPQNDTASTNSDSSDTSESDSDSSSDTPSDSSSDTSSDTSSETSSSEPNPIINAFIVPPALPNRAQSSISSNSSTSPHPKVLVFTSSTSSAHRLSHLLSLLSPNIPTSTLTRSTTSSSSTRKALRAFLTGKTQLLIATDRASRGLDIPGLSAVVNYDVPSSVGSYVHRVGRTARAGEHGEAWTLVEWREGRWFFGAVGGKNTGGGEEGKGKERIARAEGARIKRVETLLEEGEWGGEEGRKRYEDALGRLGDDVRGVGRGG